MLLSSPEVLFRKGQIVNHTMSFVLSLFFVTRCLSAGFEINTTLMHYTFRIEGPTDKPNEVTYGTGFLMAIPIPDVPDKGRPILVTAAHVLSKISGKDAKVYLREETADGAFRKVVIPVRIREEDKPLWVQHPNADVAVIGITPPSFLLSQGRQKPLPSTDLLADDAFMQRYEIHPGDELLCLGYPLGVEANPQGFAILRSGRIASFPLTPANAVRSFLYDFEVFGGNSGGPVYFVDKSRTYGGTMHLGETVSSIVGLVTQEKFQPSTSVKLLEDSSDKKRYEVTETREDLNLAVVVPSHFIRETLDIYDRGVK